MTSQALGSRYLLDDRIGQGGMGVVWRARDRVTGAAHAIKVLRPEYAADPAAVARFVRERTALVRFRHPNVMTLYDMIVEGERLALVMDLVAGGDLDAYRQSGGGALSPGEALGLTAQVCDALAAAHAAGIVPRDLKPANVLLDAGQARLADFGIARIGGAGAGVRRGRRGRHALRHLEHAARQGRRAGVRGQRHPPPGGRARGLGHPRGQQRPGDALGLAVRAPDADGARQPPPAAAAPRTAGTPPPLEPSGPNLVVDGDFAQPTLAAWNNQVWNTALVSDGVNGFNAAQMTATTTAGLSEIVTGLTPGAPHQLRGWISSDGGATWVGAPGGLPLGWTSRSTEPTGESRRHVRTDAHPHRDRPPDRPLRRRGARARRQRPDLPLGDAGADA